MCPGIIWKEAEKDKIKSIIFLILILRKIILKTFPEIKEEMKMRVPWYGGKYYLVGLKDSVNLGFSVKGLKKEYKSNFAGTGNYMRHLKFKNAGNIDEAKIIRLLKLVDKKSECGSCWKLNSQKFFIFFRMNVYDFFAAEIAIKQAFIS